MKASILFLGFLLVAEIAVGIAAAEPVRVKLTARVRSVDDSLNLLDGKIVVGQRLNGVYVYNTDTPNESTVPGFGEYHPYAKEARLRFASGSLVFESVQPMQDIVISIISSGMGSGVFEMYSLENEPLANGARVDTLAMRLDGSGNMTQSEALPDVVPDLSAYEIKEVTIFGSSGADFFQVTADIEVAEVFVPDAMSISPASGNFIASQHFDAAVILPRNSTVTSARATADGVLLPLTYPGNCQLEPPNSAGKPALLCPGAESALLAAGGAPIEWTVELTDGTVLTKTVNWSLVE